MTASFRAVVTAAIAAARIQHAVERHQRGVDRRLRLEQAHARNTTHRSPPHRWEKTLVAVHADPLCDVEGGAASQLYHYLWLKDPASRNTQREYKLPDTVVYKYRLPTFWYFTSSQSGEILRKQRTHVVGDAIIEAFTKRKVVPVPDAPCAVHIFRGRGAGHASRRHVLVDDDDHEGGDSKVISSHSGATVMQYFDAAGLREFVTTAEKQQDAVLQRFVAPRGSSASVIRTTWTPALCVLERRTNRHALGDGRCTLPLQQRCLTFEASEADAVSDPIHSGVLAERLGADDALYFLYASALRLQPTPMGRTISTNVAVPPARHVDLMPPLQRAAARAAKNETLVARARARAASASSEGEASGVMPSRVSVSAPASGEASRVQKAYAGGAARKTADPAVLAALAAPRPRRTDGHDPVAWGPQTALSSVASSPSPRTTGGTSAPASKKASLPYAAPVKGSNGQTTARRSRGTYGSSRSAADVIDAAVAQAKAAQAAGRLDGVALPERVVQLLRRTSIARMITDSVTSNDVIIHS